MKIDVKQFELVNNKLEERIIKSREEWSARVIKLIKTLKNIQTLTDSQIDMLSYRQQLIDKIGELKFALFKANSKYEYYFKLSYRFYKNPDSNYDMKLNSGETNKFVSSDIAIIKRQAELIQSHIDYYTETIKTLDNLGFAIKRRYESYQNDLE